MTDTNKEKKVYDKWCVCADCVICPSTIYVCRCRIDRPLSDYEAYVETEYGAWECIYLDEIYDTKEEAEQQRTRFLNEMQTITIGGIGYMFIGTAENITFDSTPKTRKNQNG